MRFRNVTSFLALATVMSAAVIASAQVKGDPETILEGLDNPCGVAIQPETKDIFVADSGAGRIVRVVDGKAQDVIVEFPKDVYGKGPMYNIGPLGIAFLTKDLLVVGGGGLPDGEELLRIYKVPEKGADPIKADQMEKSFQLEAKDDVKGEGNFYALAISDNAIYVTANGDDEKGWVAKANRNGVEVGPFERAIATKDATKVDAPVGITMSPDGYVVVGQMGEITEETDSLLTFYDEKGEKQANFETGLHDIAALAYSKKQLYALDFAWADSKKGGLYRLVAIDSDTKCQAKLMVALDKPSAMVYDAENDVIYVTVFGTAEEEGKKSGKLIKISGDL